MVYPLSPVANGYNRAEAVILGVKEANMSKKHKKDVKGQKSGGIIPEKPADKENAPYKKLAEFTMIPPPGEGDCAAAFTLDLTRAPSYNIRAQRRTRRLK